MEKLLLVGLLIFGLSACGLIKKKSDEDDEEETKAKTTDVIKPEMQNPNAFSSSSEALPSSLAADALPAAALPAAMTSSSSANALPAAAIPASFSSSDSLPDLPPSNAFNADVSGFLDSSFFLKFATIKIDRSKIPSLNKSKLSNLLTDASQIANQMRLAGSTYGQAQVITNFIRGTMLSQLVFTKELFQKLTSSTKPEKDYFLNSAIVWYLKSGDTVTVNDTFADTDEGESIKTSFSDVKLICQAAKDAELPTFTSGIAKNAENIDNFTPEVGVKKSAKGLIWALLVSGSGPRLEAEDLVLVNGISNYEGTQGVWQVFDPRSEEPKRVLKIEYKIHDREHFINRITLNASKDAKTQHVLTYRQSGSVYMYSFFKAQEKERFVIVMDRGQGASFAGFLKHGDGKAKCWNNDLDDDDNCAQFNFADHGDKRIADLMDDPLFK